VSVGERDLAERGRKTKWGAERENLTERESESERREKESEQEID